MKICAVHITHTRLELGEKGLNNFRVATVSKPGNVSILLSCKYFKGRSISFEINGLYH